MADPVSIAGLVLAIPPLVQVLMSFTSDVKAAKTEICNYVGDLLTIKGILEYLESIQAMQSSTDIYRFESSEFKQLLDTTWSTVRTLQQSFQPKKSSLEQSLQRFTWAFKKKEANEQLARIERLKSAFLMVLMGDNMNYSQAILSELSQLRSEISDDRSKIESEIADKEKTALLEWLAPAGPEPTHTTFYRHRVPGTGSWFLQGPLKAWEDLPGDNAAVLWLQGKSGSGKTTLIASAIEHLKANISSTSSTGFVYFYCSFGTLATQKPANILASALVQLCNTVPSLYNDLSTKFTNMVERKSPQAIEAKELETILLDHTTKLDRFYFLVDAINESEQSSALEAMLYSLARRHNNIRLMVTSTSSLDRSHFGNANLIESTMDTKVIDEDIATYLDSQMLGRTELSSLTPTLQHDVRAAILDRSKGVFRYAESQIASVQSQYTARDIKRALSGMPSNLNEVYSRILSRHNANTSYHTYMRRILLWLSFANRPLLLNELCEAVVVEDGDVDLDSDSRLHDPNMLLRLGQGLFELDRASGCVTLSHSSVKTFLTSSYIRTTGAAYFALEETEAHNVIVRTCLMYLRFSPFGTWRTDLDIQKLSLQYPLLPYAAPHWPLHIRDAGKYVHREIFEFLGTIHKPHGGNYAFWIDYMYGGLPLESILRTSPLYYAASFGFAELLSILIAYLKPLKLEQPGGRNGSTALQVACFRLHRRTAELLVEAGANPFSLDGFRFNRGFSSLFWAKENGWNDFVEWMIKRGIANGFKFQDRLDTSFAVELAQDVQRIKLEWERSTTQGAA